MGGLGANRVTVSEMFALESVAEDANAFDSVLWTVFDLRSGRGECWRML